MGRGSPPPHKNGCYTLVAIGKVGLGSIREFIGWPHRDAQGGLVLLVGVYLGSETVRHCLIQTGPSGDFTHFSVASIPHPPSLRALEHSNLFGGLSQQALMNILITETVCSITRS